MRVLIFILLLITVSAMLTMSVAYGETLVIDNPGSAGLDNFTSDNIVDIRSARQLINCDIENGDIVKRIGYYVADGNSDTLCDGITSFYDFENNARLIKATYDNDTGIFKYTNPNSLTFASDSIANMYHYKNPPFGYDWVQYENAIIGANGKNHPFLYMKDEWGTLSIPTPGAPMVSVLNVAGNLNGTYSYKIHFYDGDTSDAAKSFPGPQTVLVFPKNEKVILWGFPGRIKSDGINDIDAADPHIIITRTKDGGDRFFVVDTLVYDSVGIDAIYIDNVADGSLGGLQYMTDSTISNCCEDSVPVPGEPYGVKESSVQGWTIQPLGEAWVFDTFHFAYSYLDTTFGMESSIGDWWRLAPADSADSGDIRLRGFVPNLGNNFIDGLVIYCTIDLAADTSDTIFYRIFDTVYGDITGIINWYNYTPNTWGQIDSTIFYDRSNVHPKIINNQLPYDYMDFSFSRFWGAGDDDFPSRLYWSGRSDTGALGGSGLGEWDFAFNYLGLAENDGDRITGVKAIEEGLLAFKGYSSWFITGFDPDWDMRVQKLSGTIGAVSNNAIANYDREIYFLSPLKRVYKLSGFTDISFKIKSSLQDLSLDTLGQANMIVHEGELWMRLNDTVFICDLKTGRFEWRKYELKGEKYFTYYDSTSSVDYPRAQQLVFSKVGTDSLFGYPRTDGNMEDAQIHSGTPDDPYAVLYKSAPFLIGANTKVIQGTIDAEFGDSIYIRLLSLNDDTLASVTLREGEQISGDNFEFGLNGGFSNGYHIVITESGKTDTNLSSFRIKRITLDYIRYKVR